MHALESYYENEMQPRYTTFNKENKWMHFTWAIPWKWNAMIPLTWNGRKREVGENALPHVTHVWKNCENALTSLKREGIKGTVNWMKVKV